MASKLFHQPSYLLLLLFLITYLEFLGHIAADHGDHKKVYIVYMGDRVQPYESTKEVYLNMIEDALDSESDRDKASEYLLYTYESFQGCVAKLSEVEAEKLSKMDGVVSVFPSEKMELHTTRSWDFMGFSSTVERSTNESDVIVGIIDSGIWPESASFSDVGLSRPPSKWRGTCQTRNITCNNKLIGARYFRADGSIPKGDINSPRDSDGHGTHTASIAAGVAVNGASFLGLGQGTTRGAVPSARIAVYKVCWSDSCWSADMLAGFDAAIADGVDIISASIGYRSPRQYFNDSILIGSFHAMRRGILTSVSAGNNGPDLRTTSNVAPWQLSVAASTIDRKFTNKVQLGNGLVLEGAAVNTFDLRNKLFPLIYGGDAQNTSSTSSSRFCSKYSLNRTLVAGKIVLCDRRNNGTGPLLAGAAGHIMQGYNPRLNTPRISPLPASHLTNLVAAPILPYIRTPNSNPVGSITKSVGVKDTSAPTIAPFSSRGPNRISPGILKPDLIAPGVTILAAWSPIAPVIGVVEDTRSVAYNIISGTSMACPHATGVAAYVKSFHPTWSPAAIKSALMTTASPMTTTVEAEFGYGSGHINPLKAKDPGLVYDVEESDYVKFLCSEGLSVANIRRITGQSNTTCTDENGVTIRNWDLNYPSISVPRNSSGPFSVTFKRTVTNVGSRRSVYRVTVNSPIGTIRVQPSVLTFTSIGQKLSFTVGISGTIAANSTMSASLVWDDGTHQVRSPIVVHNLS